MVYKAQWGRSVLCQCIMFYAMDRFSLLFFCVEFLDILLGKPSTDDEIERKAHSLLREFFMNHIEVNSFFDQCVVLIVL